MSETAAARWPPLPREVVKALERPRPRHIPLISGRRLGEGLGEQFASDASGATAVFDPEAETLQ